MTKHIFSSVFGSAHFSLHHSSLLAPEMYKFILITLGFSYFLALLGKVNIWHLMQPISVKKFKIQIYTDFFGFIGSRQGHRKTLSALINKLRDKYCWVRNERKYNYPVLLAYLNPQTCTLFVNYKITGIDK